MATTVDYYFSVASPWTYLGSARFMDMTRRHGAVVNVTPIELARVFAASGGTAYPDRPLQRRQYRQVDLARWSHRLGIPLTLHPRFYPVDRQPASCLLIAAREMGLPALALSHRILRAIWHEERNIADWDLLRHLVDEAGLDGTAVVERARAPAAAQRLADDTEQAIRAGVFGAPSYVIDGELFWGQDRLDFVEDRLRTG